MEEKSGREFSLSDIFSAFLRRWWILVLALLLGAGAVFGVSYARYTPTYRAGAKMYVNNESQSLGGAKGSISSADLAAAKALVNTYCEIMKTKLTLNEVIRQAKEKYGYDYSYSQLVNMVGCASVGETEIFTITVTGTNPEHAINLVNTIVDVLPEQIAKVIEGTSARAVDRAESAELIAPGMGKRALIGGLAALFLAAAAIFVYDILYNDVLEKEEWISETFEEEIPLLGTIPDITSRRGHGYGARYGYGRYYRAMEKGKGSAE